MEEKAREKRLFVVDLDRLPIPDEAGREEFNRRLTEETERVIDRLPDTIAVNELLGLMFIVLGVVSRVALDPKFISSPLASAVEAIAERLQRAVRDARAFWTDVEGQRH